MAIVTKLADNYYKIRMDSSHANYANIKYIMFSASGSATDLVITRNEVIDPSIVENMFEKSSCTINSRYSGGTSIVTAGGYFITDYIPCSPESTITWRGGTLHDTLDKIAFYKADKSPVSSSSFAYTYFTEQSSGSNPATHFKQNDDGSYSNVVGSIWMGSTNAKTQLSGFAYVRINSYVTKTTSLNSYSEIPDITITVTN